MAVVMQQIQMDGTIFKKKTTLITSTQVLCLRDRGPIGPEATRFKQCRGRDR
jgi:hypothetical protein